MLKEIWKDIEGYDGLYQISNLGRVKSLQKNKERIMKPGTNGRGYLKAYLYKDGKIKGYYIHILTARAFIPNPNNFPEINHIDENKSNNAWTNLEWCTSAYNSRYGTRAERIAKAKSKPVLCIETGVIYESAKKASTALGMGNSAISNAIYQNRSVAGYHWMYVAKALDK